MSLPLPYSGTLTAPLVRVALTYAAVGLSETASQVLASLLLVLVGEGKGTGAVDGQVGRGDSNDRTAAHIGARMAGAARFIPIAIAIVVLPARSATVHSTRAL